MSRFKKQVDTGPNQTKTKFFFKKQCIYCTSDTLLELDRVDPLTYPPEDIWKWTEYDRDKFIFTECQILCSECYLKKKRLWKDCKTDGGLWYKEFVRNK